MHLASICKVECFDETQKPRNTRRKLVHYNHPLQLGHCNSWEENAYKNYFGCHREDFGYSLFENHSQKSPCDNYYDLYMHSLAMSLNGEVFFEREITSCQEGSPSQVIKKNGNK